MQVRERNASQLGRTHRASTKQQTACQQEMHMMRSSYGIGVRYITHAVAGAVCARGGSPPDSHMVESMASVTASKAVDAVIGLPSVSASASDLRRGFGFVSSSRAAIMDARR